MHVRRFLATVLIVAWLLLFLVRPGAIGQAQAPVMDYHDVHETASVLAGLDYTSEHALLITIGDSYDYTGNPEQPTRYPIYALRVSADTPKSVADNPNKNAILFECGMHPREWLASESCLILAQYLVEHIEDAASGVPELLQAVDVWIIPMSNPAGRAIDDTHGGDPRYYSTSPLSAGWRGNGDTRLCQYGVNVARNFSRGFNDSSGTVYCSGNYRGFAPFSTSEANALRQFVENHSISMVVIVHAPLQKIWNQWGSGDIAGHYMIEEAARVWRSGWSNPADQRKYDLAWERVGGGNGQFSAWLSYESARSDGEIDVVKGPWGAESDLPIAGDFDRDGELDDVALFRPSERKWFYDYDHDGDTDESVGPWGWSGDLPIAGDFDRDGRVDDVAVFRPSERKWFYDHDHDGDTDESVGPWGWSGDLPIAGDFDRDGELDDVAVFRPSERKWFYDHDHDGDTDESVGPWGWSGDLPIAGDFDRDDYLDDVAVFRPSNRVWYYDVNHDGSTNHASGPWGADGDRPLAGDFNAGGTVDDVAVFRPSDHRWYYDLYHNATVFQPDAGSLRAIQTIYVELPFKADGYYGTPYQAYDGDGSNTFHPSGVAVRNMIENSFIPMAKFFIREARSPGCLTSGEGTPVLDLCPSQDFGVVAAKIATGPDKAGGLVSHPARMDAWDQIQPAQMTLDSGHILFYRVQNFSQRVQDMDVQVRVSWIRCQVGAQEGECEGGTETHLRRFTQIPVQGAVTDAVVLELDQDVDYTITIEVRPRGGFDNGALDDFRPNDKKVLIFHSRTSAKRYRVFAPQIAR